MKWKGIRMCLLAAVGAAVLTGPASARNLPFPPFPLPFPPPPKVSLPGPPRIVLPSPPALVSIPDTGAYFAPDLDFDCFFANGYYWVPRDGRWFRARGHRGPWAVVGPRFVPRAIAGLPPDFRGRYRGGKHGPGGPWGWRGHRQGDDEGGQEGHGRDRHGRGGHGRDD